MKKMSVVVIAMALAVSMFSIANAGHKNGMGGGCGDCVQSGAPTDQYRKFQADTIDLRQEMMGKRFEMQRENLKGTPDTAKIASLQAEIKVIQGKLLAIRAQSGLPTDKCDGECFQPTDGCNKKDCGKGNGGNGSPCGKW